VRTNKDNAPPDTGTCEQKKTMSRLNTNLHLQTRAITLSNIDPLFVATPKNMPAIDRSSVEMG